MTKDEELFRKYCPDFSAGGECLEPYFSVFQAGMDVMQKRLDQLQGYLDHDIEYDIEQRNKELVEENRLLQERIAKMRRCGNCRYKGQINNGTYKYYARCAMECKNYSLWEAEDD